MGNIINKLIVLKLNSAWQPLGYCTVGRAIVDLAAGLSAKALDFEYEKDPDGTYILDEYGEPTSMILDNYRRPTDWEDWINLPVRSFDELVHYANGAKMMRVPTVLIAKNFATMPKKTFRGKPSKEAIRLRDGNRCQYTGKKLKREEGTIDHVLPSSRGGKDVWENLVYTSKLLNQAKGNMLNSEAGLRLLKQPMAPRPMPLSSLIREARHPTWRLFLKEIDD